MDQPTYLERAAAGERLPWEDYWLAIAQAAATRSTCSRRRVGAVLVRDRILIGMGYNGSPSGFPHCSEGGCPRALANPAPGEYADNDPERWCVAIHAEANCLLHTNAGTEGATLFTTVSPCFNCAKLIAAAGVSEVVAATAYPGFDAVKQFLLACGVRVRVLEHLNGQLHLVALDDPSTQAG